MRGADYIRERIDDLEKYASLGMTQGQMAPLFNVGIRQFERILSGNEDLRAACDRGKAVASVKVLGKLWNLIEEDNKAAIFFYLKTQLGWRETAKVEHSGNVGTFNISELSREDKNKLREITASLLQEVANTPGNAEGVGEVADNSAG